MACTWLALTEPSAIDKLSVDLDELFRLPIDLLLVLAVLLALSIVCIGVWKTAFGERHAEAAPIWYAIHAPRVGHGTQRHYVNCINRLMKFFGDLRLDEIRIDHLERYQRQRSAGTGLRKAGPSCINHELNTLSQILSRAGLWEPIEPHYRPMRLPRPKVGCALEADEAERLFRTASSNHRWMVAYCCALISANTTADGSALRFLKLRNIHIDTRCFDIDEGEKNEYRYRTLPLNEPAFWAMQELVKRAGEKGATHPDHYLLPHRARNGEKGFDPTRPMYGWRTAWDKLRKTAGLPKFRFKDIRHHVITELLEDEDVSERTVIELAGHVSRAMLDRYSHIRMKSKRQAVEALAKKKQLKEPQHFLLNSSTASFIMPPASSPVETIPRKPAKASDKVNKEWPRSAGKK